MAPGTTTHHLTLYRAASGALVFCAGTVQWTWGLDQTHDGDGAPADPRMQQAQVNLLADMGAQPASLMPRLVAATASTDHTAPTSPVSTPGVRHTIANGAQVTVTGTASDAGGRVAGVEVSTDGGATWHAATGTTTAGPTATTSRAPAPQTVQVRAIDDSGNYPSTPATVALTVHRPVQRFRPGTGADSGCRRRRLGRTRPAVHRRAPTGFITGVRFFKSTGNTGTHTGSLWTAAGSRLATVTFTGETASGWQTATFASAVRRDRRDRPTSCPTRAPNGHYAATPCYWSYRGTDRGAAHGRRRLRRRRRPGSTATARVVPRPTSFQHEQLLRRRRLRHQRHHRRSSRPASARWTARRACPPRAPSAPSCRSRSTPPRSRFTVKNPSGQTVTGSNELQRHHPHGHLHAGRRPRARHEVHRHADPRRHHGRRTDRPGEPGASRPRPRHPPKASARAVCSTQARPPDRPARMPTPPP